MQQIFTGENAKAKKSVLTAEKILCGSGIHTGGNRQSWANPDPSAGVSFHVGEKTAALLLLCRELNMILDRVAGLVDAVDIDSYLEPLTESISESKWHILGIVADNINEAISTITDPNGSGDTMIM